MTGLSLQSLSKRYGAVQALSDFTLSVAPGEIVALLGPSGCGKSTLLALIAGLERPDAGEILWDDQPLAEIPTHQRNFGLMFQDFALFPHKNVAQNVTFGLQMARWPTETIQSRLHEVLTLVGLEMFASRDVNTLSGGEAQRVALARSLAPRPRLLMLDEPLGALDRSLRDRLALELRDILKQHAQTALYVTHDQEEALVVADRVVVMHAGRIEQVGAPQELYRHPANRFVAQFFGFVNFLPGQITQKTSGLRLVTPLGEFPLSETLAPNSTPILPGEVTALLRPYALHLDGQAKHRLPATLVKAVFRGAVWRLTLRCAEIELIGDFPPHTVLPEIGSQVEISFDPAEALILMP